MHKCQSTACGHSLMQHDGDESGMGGGNPCMVSGCPCEEYMTSSSPIEPLPGHVLEQELPLPQLYHTRISTNTFVMYTPRGLVKTTIVTEFIPTEEER